MIIGITGHQELDDPSAWDWIQKEFGDFLSQYQDSLIGVSSLAIGADQYFAEAVLELGGTLNAVIPFTDYEYEFEEQDRVRYLQFLQRATNIEILNINKTDEEAFLQAVKTIVDKVDLLVAVWDGKPAAGLGGTADIVKYAKQKAKFILHLNPINRSIIRY